VWTLPTLGSISIFWEIPPRIKISLQENVPSRFAQKNPQVLGKASGNTVMAHKEPQSALRIDEVALCVMVDGVACALLPLLEVDLELTFFGFSMIASTSSMMKR
jgi:hypothetical protein